MNMVANHSLQIKSVSEFNVDSLTIQSNWQLSLSPHQLLVILLIRLQFYWACAPWSNWWWIGWTLYSLCWDYLLLWASTWHGNIRIILGGRSAHLIIVSLQHARIIRTSCRWYRMIIYMTNCLLVTVWSHSSFVQCGLRVLMFQNYWRLWSALSYWLRIGNWVSLVRLVLRLPCKTLTR